MEYSVVIVAAGSGARMNLGYNKVYYKINGVPILQMAMSLFIWDEDCKQIVVVTDNHDYRTHIKDNAKGKVVIAKGGETRQDSVANGLEAVICDKVMIHDGARPYLDEETLMAVKRELETEEAVCVMVPCTDTIKKVEEGYIVETIPRNTLMAAQTPQAFSTDLIRTCMKRAQEDHFIGTDDCSLVEKYSTTPIKIVEGTFENKKITTLEDLK